MYSTERIRRLPSRLIAPPKSTQTKSDVNIHHQQPRQASTAHNANIAAKPPQDEPSCGSDNIVTEVTALGELHPRFGPLYGARPYSQDRRDRAWDHVMKKSREREMKNAQLVQETYSRVIGLIAEDARKAYADKVPLPGPDFRWMMIKDGCYFLQMALLILGCSHQLGYMPSNSIFDARDKMMCIEAMFYAGNQIPLFVLRELMRQDFFKDVVEAKWKRSSHKMPSGLCSKVLYEVLVLPVLQEDPGRICRLMGLQCGNGSYNDQPCDILHALHNTVIGPGPGQASSVYDDRIDMEAANEDVEIGIDNDDDDGIDGGVSRSVANHRKRILFSSATELERAGIRIRRLRSGGARGIHFESYYFWAFLYLPVLPVDHTMETMLRSLKAYEACREQSAGRVHIEVRSYLRLMRDIIRTRKDTMLVEKRGVILGNPDDMERLPGVLRKLSDEDMRLTRDFGVLRRKIRDYSSPLVHYKGLINLVMFLTLIQTIFTIVAYFKPPHDSSKKNS